jgi:hypothetical protein
MYTGKNWSMKEKAKINFSHIIKENYFAKYVQTSKYSSSILNVKIRGRYCPMFGILQVKENPLLRGAREHGDDY